MIVTSSNTTANGFTTQYNDAYRTVGRTELFGAFNNSLFPELREDAGGGFWLRAWDAIEAYATPVSASADPTLRRVTQMCAAGIPVREFNNVGNTSQAYLHSKYMTASFVRDGSAKLRVWQGSEEWKTQSLTQDEFVLRLASTSAYNSYAGSFNSLWGKAANACA